MHAGRSTLLLHRELVDGGRDFVNLTAGAALIYDQSTVLRFNRIKACILVYWLSGQC